MATATTPSIPPALEGRAVNDQPISVDEYLEREQDSLERSEYVDGWQINMTAAASWPHSVITSNIDRELGTQLKGSSCRTASRDIKVVFPSEEGYAYPDVLVVCGEPDLEADRDDLLHNPILVIEVLSPATMDYDRGEKFARYRQLDSLQEYVLVAQDRPHVEHYVRQEDESWRFTEMDGLDRELSCPSIEVTLPLEEIYLDVFDLEENE